MNISQIKYTKVKRRLWGKLVQNTLGTFFYRFIYRSYWHYLLFGKINSGNAPRYYTAFPNPGAGIGHQLANWIAGCWWAKQFDAKHVHTSFSSKSWEFFFGFGENELKLEDLIKQGFRLCRLPKFNEFDLSEVYLNRKIMSSYGNRKIVFVAEQDQGYKDQFGVIEHIKGKFFTSKARQGESLFYDKSVFNIAVHIRRGDIEAGRNGNGEKLEKRWQDNSYFENLLSNVLNTISGRKIVVVYVFSQGNKDAFADFDRFPNVHFCLDTDAQQSFLHLIYADLLIASRSSFSYKAALLSNGIKLCPPNFWHSYPNEQDWITASDSGHVDSDQLQMILDKKLPLFS